MFLFIVIPADPLLGNYRRARYMMAGAYLFFVVAGIVEYLFDTSSPDVSNLALMQTVTLVIAASQAFLFTFAMLALLDVRFPGWRYIFRETACVLLFIIAVVSAYTFFSGNIFRNTFYIFTGIYALLLVRYTFLFFKSYRLFGLRMDNYFSDMEAGRLRWVAFSFFAALAVGVMALLSSLFMSTLVALLFVIIFDIFYIFFAIRFVNYAYQFHTIGRAMDDETPEDAEKQCTVVLHNERAAGSKKTKKHSAAFALLEKRIEKWIDDKGFTEQGITIDALAVKLVTNNKYLSTYINTYKKQTFRDWINELRIEEAKILLLQYPELTVNEIAHNTGFSDKSHFLRRFKEQVKLSPTNWKNISK
jgi:AraC-like DNA-binding protein